MLFSNDNSNRNDAVSRGARASRPPFSATGREHSPRKAAGGTPAAETGTVALPKIERKSAGGFTRRELLVVVVLLVVLPVMFGPPIQKARQKAWLIYCNNNLKELGTAYRLWADDNHDLMPFQASVTNGGWRELLANPNAGQYCWTNYAIMREQLREEPIIIVCPADKRRSADNFIVKGTTNDTGNAAFKDNTTVSYFVGVTSSFNYPSSFLGGERNLGPGPVPDPNYGFSPAGGQGNDVILYTNSSIAWSLKMHSHGNAAGHGNIMLGDGSAQQVSSAAFTRNWLPNASTGTNFSGTNQLGFRLVFP